MKQQIKVTRSSKYPSIVLTWSLVLLAGCGQVRNLNPTVDLAPEQPQLMSLAEGEERALPGVLNGTGTSFQVTDSAYLNVGLLSDLEIKVKIESIPDTITLSIQAAAPGTEANLTFLGLQPSKTYYAYNESRTSHTKLTSDANGVASLTLDLTRPRLLFLEVAPGTIYLGADGSGCSQLGVWSVANKTCTLNKDVADHIVINGDGITLDGAGHTIKSQYKTRSHDGIYAYNRANLEIKNIYITGFNSGVTLYGSHDVKIHNVTFDDVSYGIYASSRCHSWEQQYDSSGAFIGWICTSSTPNYNNSFYSNNFLSNTYWAIYNDEYYNPQDKRNTNKAYLDDVTGGNFYWGHPCSNSDADSFCDSAAGGNSYYGGYYTNWNVLDKHPLVKPLGGWPVAITATSWQSRSYKDSPTFSFDASRSYNPDGGTLTFDWDFGDGGTAMDAGPKVQHDFPRGRSEAVATVTNSAGKKSRVRHFIDRYNSTPRANSDSLVVGVNSSGSVNVLANDSDYETAIDPSTLALYSYYPPKNGTATIGSTPGTIDYTPKTDFVGNDWFYYTVKDDEGAQGFGLVNVSVQAANSAPTLTVNTETITVAEGAQATNTGTFSDADGDSVTLSASLGTLTKGSGTWAWTFTPNDNVPDQTVTITANDGRNEGVTKTFTLKVTNVSPTAGLQGSVIQEGSTGSVSFTNPSDPSTADRTAGFRYAYDTNNDGSFDVGDGTYAGSSTSTSVSVPGIDGPSSIAVRARILDKDNGYTDYTTDIEVSNVPPTLGYVTPITTDPVAVNTAVSISAPFSDPGSKDTHVASISWGNGSSTAGEISAGKASGSHAYTAAGVYTVQMTVTDDDGGSDSEIYQYVVVYDPSAGFVTGGGWIDSPVGAYAADPSMTGKANFGFVSKYQKGATIPSGQTQFQFHAGGLNFHSTVYEWLVVSGPKGQYKGSGKVNGSGDYGFILTANDGQVTGGGGIDRFRIKIWEKATSNVIYDNQMGMSDDGTAADAIEGGSIVIHSSKK